MRIIIIISLFSIFQCSKPVFYRQEDNLGRVKKIEWSFDNVILTHRTEDHGAFGTNKYLVLSKKLLKDSVNYKLDYKSVNCTFIVKKDTLFLYEESDDSGLSGWYEVESNGTLSCLDYFQKEVWDTVKVSHLYGNLYKWNGYKLEKISNNINDFMSIIGNREEGIYYIPSPGVGVKYKYNLKELSEKLNNIKSYRKAPDVLD